MSHFSTGCDKWTTWRDTWPVAQWEPHWAGLIS